MKLRKIDLLAYPFFIAGIINFISRAIVAFIKGYREGYFEIVSDSTNYYNYIEVITYIIFLIGIIINFLIYRKQNNKTNFF